MASLCHHEGQLFILVQAVIMFWGTAGYQTATWLSLLQQL